MTAPTRFARRNLVLGTAALVGAGGAAAAIGLPPLRRNPPPVLPPPVAAAVDHLPFGPVRPPRLLPDPPVLLDDGGRAGLRGLGAGRWTWLQLMFTGCTTTCPIQGAIFQTAEAEFGRRGRKALLLSLSVDPVSDDAAALAAWRRRFGAGADWRAAAPPFERLVEILDTLNGRGAGVDIHDGRAYLVDPQGRYVFATADLPDGKVLADLLDQAVASSGAAS